MVVCKHFLQGTCRFGDNCKFEHAINDSDQFSNSVLRQTVSQTSSNFSFDLSTLVRSVVNDQIQAENGRQWLLSSYAPFKNKPAFPGFEDKSFEEVRWGYYEARNNGSLEQYKIQLQIALQEALMRIRALQNPTQDLMNIIRDIYNTPSPAESPASSTANSNTSIFGNNVFASQSNMHTSFAPSQSQYSFATTGSSIFNPISATMVQPQQQQQSIFRSSNQNMFGGAPQNYQQEQQKPLFGGSTTVFGSSSQSIFSGQPITQSTPMLATNQQQPPSSIFNQQPQFSSQQLPSMFHIQTSSAPFGFQASVSSSVPSASSASATFGGSQSFASIPAVSSTIFGVPSRPMTATTTPFGKDASTTSIFGGSISMAVGTNSAACSETGVQTTAASDGVIVEEAYSKLEDLTEEEIKSFEAESFEFGKIPDKPPTFQMCV